jgi:predicted ArsR family transcriptional regulator
MLMSGVGELTAHLGLRHNAIRQHLAKLTDAGLVVEARAPPVKRGRPGLVYTVDPVCRVQGGRRSARASVAAVVGDHPDRGLTRRRRPARWSTGTAATRDTTDPVAGLVDTMERHGFEPAAKRRRNRVDIVLEACPFATKAWADAETVCGLHLASLTAPPRNSVAS